MSYTNSVTFLDTDGGNGEITVRVWMLWTVIGSGSGTGNQQQETDLMDGTINTGGSVPMPINFIRDADFSSAFKIKTW
jgi:hypothetical protein